MRNHEDSSIEYRQGGTNKIKREILSFINSLVGGVINVSVGDVTHEVLEIRQESRHQWK